MEDVCKHIPSKSEIWVEFNGIGDMSIMSRVMVAGNQGKPPSPLIAVAERALQRTVESDAMLQRIVYVDIRRQGMFQILDAVINYRTFLEQGAREMQLEASVLTFLMPLERAFFTHLSSRKDMHSFLRSILDPLTPEIGWFQEQVDRFVANGMHSAKRNPVKEAMLALPRDMCDALVHFVIQYWRSAIDHSAFSPAMRSALASHRTGSAHLVMDRYEDGAIPGFFRRLFAIIMDVYVVARLLSAPPVDAPRMIFVGENHANMIGNILTRFAKRGFTFHVGPSGVDMGRVAEYAWIPTHGDPKYMLKRFRNQRAKKYNRQPPYELP